MNVLYYSAPSQSIYLLGAFSTAKGSNLNIYMVVYCNFGFIFYLYILAIQIELFINILKSLT